MEEKVKKQDWKNLPMPEERTSFQLEGAFTQEIIDKLKKGHMTQAMEDKWFYYEENNKLYIHRSWTGYCIYIVDLNIGDSHTVIVNRNDQEYKSKDVEYDRKILQNLLHYNMTNGTYNEKIDI